MRPTGRAASDRAFNGLYVGQALETTEVPPVAPGSRPCDERERRARPRRTGGGGGTQSCAQGLIASVQRGFSSSFPLVQVDAPDSGQTGAPLRRKSCEPMADWIASAGGRPTRSGSAAHTSRATAPSASTVFPATLRCSARTGGTARTSGGLGSSRARPNLAAASAELQVADHLEYDQRGRRGYVKGRSRRVVVKIPPPGSARNSAIWSLLTATAVTPAPGVVLPSETLLHNSHPVLELPVVLKTAPVESATNSAKCSWPLRTTAIWAPGLACPPDTPVHGAQPAWALPEVVKMSPAASARKSTTRSGPTTTAVTGAPGMVRPSETLVHGAQPLAELPELVKTPPP